MSMKNGFTLIGRTTKDVRLVDSKFKDADGNPQKTGFTTIAIDNGKDKDGKDYPADFIDLAINGKTAETLAKYVGKGSLIAVEGKIKQIAGEKQADGTYTQPRLFLNVKKIDWLQTKEPGATASKSAPQTNDDEDIIFE